MTGNGRLAVGFGGMEGLAGEIQAGVSQLRNRLDRLEQDLTPLKGDWTGAASDAYQRAKLQWDDAVNDLNRALEQTGHAVTDSSGDYKKTENANAASFGG